MRRAVSIKTVGDKEIGGVLESALIKPLETEELATVKAELEKTKAENTKLGVRKVRDNKTFERKVRKANRKYAVRSGTKIGDALLVSWALFWVGIYAVAAKLRAWNREK